MDVHLRSAFHPLLGRVRIGASRVRPLFPELHTSDYSFACPGSSTWVDKVPSRDTPTLNLAGHRDDVALDAPQVARRVAGLRCRNPAPSEPDGTIARHPAQASAALYAARKVRLRLRHALPFLVTPIGSFDAKASSNFSNGSCRSVASLPPRPVGSLHPFGLGMSRSRRPYLPRYRAAFACSDSPLPPPSSPFLAVGIPPCGGTSGAYPVVQCGDADGEVASCSPAGHGATVVDGSNRRADPHAILAPACQHFWPVLDDGP
jgi:hypothetical protein